MKFISLFAGIDGIGLGLERAGMICAAQVEIDPFCRRVLQHRWPHVPKFEDVKTFNRRSINDDIDLVSGGFPCQDISVAGKGEGLSGSRSGLWWEMCRIISEFRPIWVIAENVPALRTRGADEVISSLEELGYSVEPLVVGAWAVGLPHKRDRVWIVAKLADARGVGCFTRPGLREGAVGESRGRREDVANAHSTRREERNTSSVAETSGFNPRRTAPQCPARPSETQFEWEAPRIVELPLGGSVDGVPVGLVRSSNLAALKAYGNSVVPQIPELIGRFIMR